MGNEGGFVAQGADEALQLLTVYVKDNALLLAKRPEIPHKLLGDAAVQKQGIKGITGGRLLYLGVDDNVHRAL